MISSILERGKLNSHGEPMTLKLEAHLLLVILQSFIILVKPSTSGKTGASRRSIYTKFLLPYGTRYINNERLVGIKSIQHMFMQEPEHGLHHIELERGYRVLISLELSKTLEELKIDEFGWVKPKILKEADKLYNVSFDYSSEEDYF
ncbi:unnamed protein product [Lactuca saligna]|uniref:Uncharacterized protein n=1 Tax=Lactuca saligna TaxID=75948 RepID=A0AA35YTY2_LACSI|nr:unnamed protein product [Lactuca saligna]